MPKLQASSRSAPVYDVLHTNSNEQWAAPKWASSNPRSTPSWCRISPTSIRYAISDKIVGVSIFTSAIGLGIRTDKGYSGISSSEGAVGRQVQRRRAAAMSSRSNSLGQAFLMMCGTLYGKGQMDLDAAYAALEKLKPIKLVDFTGAMEKMFLSGEVGMGVIHDSGIYRYDGRQPADRFHRAGRGRALAGAGADHHARQQS